MTMPFSADPYVAALEKLWDILSDTIEGGRLLETDLPVDYDAMVRQMEKILEFQSRRTP